MPLEDREAYLKLKDSFYSSNSPILCKEKDKSTFPAELETIRTYIESKSTGIEERSIIVGVAFQPTFLSVNIQRLKILLNRCKSSINKGFQQINYISEKSQVKSHVIKSIPLLTFHPEEIRQWTIRIPSNGSKDLPIGFKHISYSINSNDIFQNFNLGSNKLQNDKPIFLPPIHNKLLPTPYIEINKNQNSRNVMLLNSEQNIKPKLCFSFPNQQQQIPNYIKSKNANITPIIQNPPEIRLCNSQYIESNFSLDDFDINNGHDFNINDDDSSFFCNSCQFNDICDHSDNNFDFSLNSHADEMYAEYHNHDDPQDDDIAINITSDNNGSSIDIRNNFS